MTWLAYEILLALVDGPLHGYGIIKEVERRTGGATLIEAGTLYAALKRMRDEGLLEVAGVDDSGPGRRRRDYRLSAQGRYALERESQRLACLVDTARAKRVIPGGAPA